LFDYVNRQKNYKADRRSAAKLSLNGSRGAPLFSDDAGALIHTTARGYPRAVNNLALKALVATYAAGKAIVDEQSARAAVTEVTDT
jgi:type II secretory pathway predicted ATPase ExeA